MEAKTDEKAGPGGGQVDAVVRHLPAYIEVSAEVRYWEDAEVNGVEDTEGRLIPFRFGKLWKPEIRLADGMVLNWPEGMEAEIHYKVCDQGEYWLLDKYGSRIAKWKGDYVPDSFLCQPDHDGLGDYIIFRVGKDGRIEGWTTPTVESNEWAAAA